MKTCLVIFCRYLVCERVNCGNISELLCIKASSEAPLSHAAVPGTCTAENVPTIGLISRYPHACLQETSPGLLHPDRERKGLETAAFCSTGWAGCCRWPCRGLCHGLEQEGLAAEMTSGGTPSLHEIVSTVKSLQCKLSCMCSDVSSALTQAWQRWDHQRGAPAAPAGDLRRGAPRSAGGIPQPGR